MPIVNKPKHVHDRFSKQLVAEYLATRIERTSFDASLGWDQVKGQGEARNREYGAFAAAIDMIEELDL